MSGNALLASLPDPSEPTVLALGAAIGALLANTVSRLRRAEPEQRVQLAFDWSHDGMVVALIVYVIANLVEV